MTPQQFFSELFGSRAAACGEVIRRKVRDVERYVGREVLVKISHVNRTYGKGVVLEENV